MIFTIHDLIEMLKREPNQMQQFKKATVSEIHGKILLRLNVDDPYGFEATKIIELKKGE